MRVLCAGGTLRGGVGGKGVAGYDGVAVVRPLQPPLRSTVWFFLVFASVRSQLIVHPILIL